MIENRTLHRLVSVEYFVIRTPLLILDRHVVSPHLSPRSVVRRSFESGLGLLDEAAGRLLGDPAPTGDGLPDDERRQVERVAGELAAEQEQTRHSGELAADEDIRRTQTQLRARHIVEEAEQAESS